LPLYALFPFPATIQPHSRKPAKLGTSKGQSATTVVNHKRLVRFWLRVPGIRASMNLDFGKSGDQDADQRVRQLPSLLNAQRQRTTSRSPFPPTSVLARYHRVPSFLPSRSYLCSPLSCNLTTRTTYDISRFTNDNHYDF